MLRIAVCLGLFAALALAPAACGNKDKRSNHKGGESGSMKADAMGRRDTGLATADRSKIMTLFNEWKPLVRRSSAKEYAHFQKLRAYGKHAVAPLQAWFASECSANRKAPREKQGEHVLLLTLLAQRLEHLGPPGKAALKRATKHFAEARTAWRACVTDVEGYLREKHKAAHPTP